MNKVRFKYNEQIDTLISAGRIGVFYKGLGVNIEKDADSWLTDLVENKELIKSIYEGLAVLEASIEQAKEKISSREIVFNQSEEETEEIFIECVDVFDDLVFLRQGLHRLVELVDNNSIVTIKERVDDLVDNLIFWFSFDFNLYRLVFYNDIRLDRYEQIPEELECLFPWYCEYVTEDPNNIFELARASVLGSFDKSLALVRAAVSEDELLSEYYNDLCEKFRWVYEALDNSPVDRLFWALSKIGKCRIASGVWVEKGFFRVCYEALETLKDGKSLLHSLVLGVCCGPVDRKERYKLLVRLCELLKKFPSIEDYDLAHRIVLLLDNRADEIDLAKDLFDAWEEECVKVAYASEELKQDEGYFKEKFVQKLETWLSDEGIIRAGIEETTNTIKEERMIKVVIGLALLSLVLSISRRARLQTAIVMDEEDEGEIKIGSYFKIRVDRKENDITLLPIQVDELPGEVIEGDLEEFDKLLRAIDGSDFWYFVVGKYEDRIWFLKEVTAESYLPVEVDIPQGVERILLFLSTNEDEIQKLFGKLVKVVENEEEGVELEAEDVIIVEYIVE